MLVGSLVALPLGIFMIKIAPQLCEDNAGGFGCMFAGKLEYIHEWGSFALLAIFTVVAPFLTRKIYFSATKVSS